METLDFYIQTRYNRTRMRIILNWRVGMNVWKRGLALLMACVLAASLFTSCGMQVTEQAENSELLSVFASFDTMADFARRIGGERVWVTTMTPSGAEPHDWEPTARDIGALAEAKLLILSGAGFEHWADGVITSLGSDTLAVVNTSAEIELSGGDPHIWLDPANAEQQMAAIAVALTEQDPEGADYYQANLEQAAADLNTLDEDFRETLDPLPKKEIVVAHEAYGYLCAAYGLTQAAVQGLAPEGEPDPARMAEIVDYVRDHEVTTIFFEAAGSSKVAEAISRETGAEIAVLSPLESIPEGEDYFSVMRQNLTALEAALS
jgi:zinc transport system substrate-binding protein